jgi:hypothetical protein
MMTAPYRIQKPGVSVDFPLKQVTLGEGLTAVPSAEMVTSQDNFNSYLERLMKMIPAEVISLYLVGSGLIPKDQNVTLLIWFIVCLAGVIILRAYGTSDSRSKLPPDWIHVSISTIAFLIWVYSLGGPFAAYNLYVPYVGSLLVLAWTFFVPIFYKGQ